MLLNSARRFLLISRFKNSYILRFSTFRPQALVDPLLLGRKPATLKPTNAKITSNSSDQQHVPKLAKENIKSVVEKIKREPLIKDFFKGKFDIDVLAFPEVLNPDEIANIHYMVEQLRHLFRTRVDSHAIDANAEIPEDILKGLKQIGLFALMTSDEYGGIKLSETAMAKLMEICGTDPSVGLTVKSHQNVTCHLFELYGNEAQKEQYLNKMCSGESVGAVCMAEEASGNDLGSIETTAKLQSNMEEYWLDGKKIWVSNGGIADVFVVFAKVPTVTEIGTTIDQLGAFIVDKSMKGVTIGPNEDKIGVKGLNLCSVEFRNVQIPKSNILLGEHHGLEIANNMLSRSRLVEGMLISGLLKELVNSTITHCIHREQYGKPLSEYDLVKERIANLGIATYAVESMVYLTTGLKDSTINPDLFMESAATKLFASEALWDCVNSCMEIFGGRAYFKSTNLERILRDAKVFSIIDGTNDILRQLIAQIGVKYLAGDIADDVEKMRNPAFFPMMNLKKMLEFHRINSGKIKLKYDLAGYLHMSLKDEADNLERSILRFEFLMQGILSKYGRQIMEKQMVLNKVAKAVVSFYAMTACLSRASRSYCIGLQNSDLEMGLTSAFCYQQNKILQNLFADLEQSEFESPNDSYKKISEILVRDKGYNLTNPIIKNCICENKTKTLSRIANYGHWPGKCFAKLLRELGKSRTLISSSPLPDDFEPEEKEVKVKLEPVPSKDVITDKKCAKEGDALKKDTSKVQPSHLEYYLNWLLKISETQKDLPIDHSCACSKSTDNPAYGLNSPQTKQPLCVNPEGVKPKFNPPNSVTRPPVSIATVVDAVKNSVRVQNVTNGNTVHRVSSPRMKVTPVSMRSHGKRHKRPESALSISSGKSRSAFNHWEGLSPDLKPTLSGAENRVRKRNHLPRRRSSRSQRQQHKIAIEEVVNLFGKHFNKALQKQTIVQPDEPNFQTSDMTTSKDLVAGYLYATLKNEQLIASRSKNTNDMKSEPSEKSLSNLNCRVKTDVQSRIPVIKPVVINAKTNGQVTRLDAEELLKKSSKLYPTKVSMVVMQCCRFLPSLDEKNIPAGQPERSLPMGTLVTALYKEKEWLYVRTAHGNVGYIHKGCCETIGTLPKRKSSLETQLAKPNFEKVVSSNDCVLINAKTAKVKSLLTSTDHRSAFREVKPSNVADRTRLKTLAAVTQEQKKNGIIFFNPESTSTLHKRTEKKEKPSSKELVVIKDYNGGCEGVITTSINVKKGDIVTIVKNDFDNWVYVQLDSGKMGYIPTSCTTKVGFL